MDRAPLRRGSRPPPSAILPGRGRAVEDLGRTAFTKKNTATARAPTTRANDSFDELDLLSPSPEIRGVTDEHGQSHNSLGQLYGKKNDGLKGLKFKKKLDTSGSTVAQASAGKRIAPNFDISLASLNDTTEPDLPTRDVRTYAHPNTRLTHAGTSDFTNEPRAVTQPKPKPRALGMTRRPKASFGRSKLISDPPNRPLPVASTSAFYGRPSETVDSGSDLDIQVLPARNTRSGLIGTSTLPIQLSSSPPRSQSAEIVEAPLPLAAPKTAAPPRKAQAFPMSTPPPPRKHQATFPQLSPLSSPASHSSDIPQKNKGKGRAQDDESLEPPSSDSPEAQSVRKGKQKATTLVNASLPLRSLDFASGGPPTSRPSSAESRTKEPSKSGPSAPKPKPRPWKKAMGKAPKEFPMSTQTLREAGRSGHVEDGDSSAAEQVDIDYDIGSSDIDDLFLGAGVDPKTLCPYCDQPLPANPTPHLDALLKAVFKKSNPDPRPSNPLGRRALVSVFVNACLRHRFEYEWMPKAQAQGWPTTIDFANVRRRVQAMAPHLQGFVDGLDSEPPDPDETITMDPSRQRSDFWEEIVMQIEKFGSKAVTGVGAQFSSFEKARPGYYGELGALVIQQTLLDMFPPESIDIQSIAPITHSEFIQRVLVPEAATSLIQEDMHQSREAALDTLQASAQYGVALFPHDTKGHGANEAEKMMKQRATARRKEIAVDEGEDDMAPSGAESVTSINMDVVDDDEPNPALGPVRQLRPRKRDPVARMASGGSDASVTKLPRRKRLKTPGDDTAVPDVIELSDSDPNPRRSREPLLRSHAGNSQETQQPSKPRPRPVARSQPRYAAAAGMSEDAENDPSHTRRSTSRHAGDSDSSTDMDVDIDIIPVRNKQRCAAKASVVVRPAEGVDKGKTKAAPAPFPMSLDAPTAVKMAKPITIPKQNARLADNEWSRSMCDDPDPNDAASDTSIDVSDVDMRSRKAKDGNMHDWLLSDDSDGGS